MRQVSNGLSLLYLWFVVCSRLLIGGFICDVVCGVALGAPEGGWAVCLEAALLHIMAVGLSPCTCRCACGMQFGARVAPS